MLSFIEFMTESSDDEFAHHPTGKMREYEPKEMDWEYHREYEKYSKPRFPHAFKSREHFQNEYDKAPLRHLSGGELKNLGNHTYVGHPGPKENHPRAEKRVRDSIGGRRDVGRIYRDLDHGKTAPPIVLHHDRGLHLMAGNTRLMAGQSRGLSVPAKVIDIRKNRE